MRRKRPVAVGYGQEKNTLSNILFTLIISAAPINVNKAKEFKDKVQKFNEKV